MGEARRVDLQPAGFLLSRKAGPIEFGISGVHEYELLTHPPTSIDSECSPAERDEHFDEYAAGLGPSGPPGNTRGG